MLNFKLNKKQKNKLIRIAITLFCFVVLFALSKIFKLESAFNKPIGWLFPFLLWFALYIFIAYDVLIKALYNLKNGRVFDENFLMLIASLGAFALGIFNGASQRQAEGFDEAVAVIIFYQIGQFFEQVATEKSRKSIAELLDIRPDHANLLKDNQISSLYPDEIEVGEAIVIYPGEKIPLDCTVIKGSSTIDNKSLTGESLPVDVSEGSTLLSGGLNLTSELVCRVDKHFYDGTVSKILDLVENASDKKSKAEGFIERFAKYYTPSVITLALLTAIIPSLIFKNWQVWVYRALSFLVVSCPCALVISVPMTFFVALGKASRSRILIKGSNYLELLARANVFLFDKTGTITHGNFEVTKVFPEENKEEILHLACIAEKKSSHPIALSIMKAYGKNIEEDYTLTNLAGLGVMATDGENEILCGNATLLENNGVDILAKCEGAVYIAKNRHFVGYIVIADTVKSEANRVIGALNNQNCKTVMLTGDSQSVAETVCKQCNISQFKAQLLPQDKVAEVEKIINQKAPNEVVCFIGDGINDAPVLMRSDVGIAMGAIGSDAAIEAADVVLMKDNLSDILTAKKIAKRALKIVKQNIVFSITVKVLILLLSLFGITNMWFSIFGDVGVAVIAILNALRVDKN